MKSLTHASKLLLVVAALSVTFAGCERRPTDQSGAGAAGTSGSSGTMGSSNSSSGMGTGGTSGTSSGNSSGTGSR